MKTLFKIVLLVSLTLMLFGCPSDDSATVSFRERQEVYDENIVDIEAYLKSNYITIDANGNAEVNKILDGGTETSIWNQYSEDGGLTFPSFTVKNDSRTTLLTDGKIDDPVDYKLYYILLDEGDGAEPKSVDSTFVSYKGWNLSNVVFDQNNSGTWFSFPDSNASISGFRQILSKVKTASSFVINSNGSVSYSNSGNVIVFIPSGLAYFSGARANINQYSSIAFQIKLHALKERDNDKDRILDKYEDLNNNNDYFDDDTDGDMIPDFLDTDDDGDAFLTKFEIRHSITTGTSPNEVTTYYYYPFDGAATDDPLTPYDDRRGIPRKFTGPIISPSTLPSPLESDFTSSPRLRRHLDATSKPPFTN